MSDCRAPVEPSRVEVREQRLQPQLFMLLPRDSGCTWEVARGGPPGISPRLPTGLILLHPEASLAVAAGELVPNRYPPLTREPPPTGASLLRPWTLLTARWPLETGKERKGLPRGRAGQTLSPQDIPSLSSGDQDEHDEVLLPPGTPAPTHAAWDSF